ncbi:MAG: chemotaxis protein CheA [Gammaproteobacteria bacterium]|nr:chemotaxis protein CheA [Gammaproteobacteria bacterium]
MTMDDEILQDFLIEAQEILENLDTQLIDLEASPHDHNLLNAVFRSFHTIKGGAGFLALDAMVEVAHKAEDVFDQLRNGRFTLDSAVMDVFLRVLDALRGMFQSIKAGVSPAPVARDLIEQLRRIAAGESMLDASASATFSLAAGGEFDEVVAGMLAESPSAGDAAALLDDGDFEALLDVRSSLATASVSPPVNEVISEAEFDALLDNLQAKSKPAAIAAPSNGAISDAEFEALLDSIQAQPQKPTAAPSVAEPVPGVVAASSDVITDLEFEKLLDKLQAKPGSAVAPIAKAKLESAPVPHISEPQPKDNTIRVGTDVLDRIMNMVGELVLVRNRLTNLQGRIGDVEMTQAVGNLDVITSDLQMAAMKTRMQPIKKVFGRFPRVVRDLARTLGKEVELELEGEETDLDKNLVEALSDPLVHLVRNAVDHGVERPAERLAAGKSRGGILHLKAEQDGDQILLTIRDDGKGMDAEILRGKSVEKGLLEEDAALRLTERECFELIFLPGFSTKEEISDVSGRGVGMDVVKTRITQLNGSIEIDSKVGVGTTIRIRVPLTLAIMPTLMVNLGSQIFALPLVNVKEIIDFRREQAQDVNGRKTLVVRGKALPLFYLSRWLVNGVHDVTVDRGHVVIVGVGSQTLGFIVDELIGQEEVVIKPLGALLSGARGLSGATITGNGRIALILDLPELIDVYGRR